MSPPPMHAHRPGGPFTSLMKKITIDVLPASPQQQQQRPQQTQQQQQQQQAGPLKRITWEKRLHKGPHKDMLEVHQVGLRKGNSKGKEVLPIVNGVFGFLHKVSVPCAMGPWTQSRRVLGSPGQARGKRRWTGLPQALLAIPVPMYPLAC